jgi:nucleoside-diphosphate-sugar epimerase
VILIAGGSGFYGINTARCLADRGEPVLLVQRHGIEPPPLLAGYWGKQVKQALGDILDLSFILGLVKAHRVKSIIHAAFGTAGSHLDPRQGAGEALHQMIEVQLKGAMNCLEAVRLMGLQRMTFISSVDLYRGLPAQCDVFDEDACLPPVSFSLVGNCKRAVEQIGFLYAGTYGISFASLRVGANYGPGCGPSPITRMIEAAVAGKPAALSMIAANRRTHPVYAKDTAEATCAVHLAKALKSYIYNVSDGTNPTMREIAGAIKEVIPSARIELGPPGEDVAERPQPVQRIKDELGFVPRTLTQGIEHYVEFLKTGTY